MIYVSYLNKKPDLLTNIDDFGKSVSWEEREKKSKNR